MPLPSLHASAVQARVRAQLLDRGDGSNVAASSLPTSLARRRGGREGSSAGTPRPRARSGRAPRPRQDRLEAQVLAELDHRLPRGVARSRSRSPCSGGCRARDRSAAGSSISSGIRTPSRRSGADSRPVPHGRQHRQRPLAEQADHLGEGQDAVGGDVEDAGELVAAPRARARARRRPRARTGSAGRSRGSSAPAAARTARCARSSTSGPSTFAQRRIVTVVVRAACSANSATAASASTMSRSIAVARRVRAPHPLGEEGRVVLLARRRSGPST